eukprot:TRINITY_DN51438_c0_g1_i1.p1 TRINITY_DN51438_c0_g1~~TRINITY_DN51438_c0_g1_i1.p1  ORF type:complete len:293 (+),score=61.63 TRINITY_DN51438_c0_g1_i1:37-879(+)
MAVRFCFRGCGGKKDVASPSPRSEVPKVSASTHILLRSRHFTHGLVWNDLKQLSKQGSAFDVDGSDGEESLGAPSPDLSPSVKKDEGEDADAEGSGETAEVLETAKEDASSAWVPTSLEDLWEAERQSLKEAEEEEPEHDKVNEEDAGKDKARFNPPTDKSIFDDPWLNPAKAHPLKEPGSGLLGAEPLPVLLGSRQCQFDGAKKLASQKDDGPALGSALGLSLKPCGLDRADWAKCVSNPGAETGKAEQSSETAEISQSNLMGMGLQQIWAWSGLSRGK